MASTDLTRTDQTIKAGAELSTACFIPDDQSKHLKLLGVVESDKRCVVTLVEAGPGYGKTSLLKLYRDILKTRGDGTVWFDADDDRLDPDRFFQHLLRDCTEQLHWSAGDLDHRSKSDVVRTLLGRLRQQPARVAIVIDQYDRIANLELDRAIADFVAAADGRVHLVIAARGKIGIPFGNRRLGGGIVRLDQEALRFSRAELEQLFAGQLDVNELTQLERWSEGWPVAVHLARAHLTGPIGAHGSVADRLANAELEIGDYIVDEIISPLCATYLKILVETSFLSTFNSDIVEAITGVQDAWSPLEALHSASLLTLVSADEDRRYRCHGLVRRALYAELRRQGRRRMSERRLAAAYWFRLQNDPVAAIPHAHAAGDTELVAALVLALDATLFGAVHGAAELSAIMEHVPADALRRFPRLVLAQAYLAAKAGEVETAAEILRGVKGRLADTMELTIDPLFVRDLAIAETTISMYGGRGLGRSALEEVQKIEAACLNDGNARAIINNLLCVIAFNASDFPEALSRCHSAIHFYKGQSSQNGLGYIHIHLGRVYAEMGQSQKAIGHYLEGCEHFMLRASDDDRSTGLAAVFLAQSLYDRGQLDDAMLSCSSLNQQSEFGGYYFEGLYSGYRTLAMIKSLRGDRGEAMRQLDCGLAFARGKRMISLEYLLSLEMLLLEQDTAGFRARLEAARPLLERIEDDSGAGESLPWRIKDLSAMIRARALLGDEEATRALAVLEEQAAECESQGRVRTLIDLLVRIALVHERCKQRDRALGALRRAVALAWKGAIVAPFLENGIDAVALLTLLANSIALKGADPGEVAFINDAVRICSELGSKAVSIFSPRELDVLHHLSQGLNNKLIARALDISPETVRFHLKAIYQKFGVKNRHANRRVVTDFAAARGLAPPAAA